MSTERQRAYYKRLSLSRKGHKDSIETRAAKSASHRFNPKTDPVRWDMCYREAIRLILQKQSFERELGTSDAV